MCSVSVIVPAYNVESYIETCINSILNQDLYDLEVIAIDDGSIDRTGEILDILQKQDARLKVIHKSNGGVTSARKTGLLIARGEYVGFVDGDDYISEKMYGMLYREAVENGVQVLLNQSFFKDYGIECTIQENNLEKGIFRDSNGSIKYVWKNIWNKDSRQGILPDLWCNLYEKDIALQIYMKLSDEVSFFEDEMFINAIIVSVKNIEILHQALYYYRARQGSACNTMIPNFLYCVQEKYDFVKSYFEKCELKSELIQQLKYKTINDLMQLRFLQTNSVSFHMFPYEKIPGNSKIILYAAGEVGQSYFRQLSVNHYCEIVLWADSRYSEMNNVSSPQMIGEVDFDYIVIAVLDKRMAEQIAEKLLIEFEISAEKIVVHVPQSFVNFIDLGE